MQSGSTPILCVGETLEEREAGVTEAVVAAPAGCGDRRGRCRGAGQGGDRVRAGVGDRHRQTATPEQAQAVHAFIRGAVAAGQQAGCGGLRILYGGSVKAANAEELFAMPDIDGGLIGGASLRGREFMAICQAADRAERCSRRMLT